MGKDI